MTGATRKSRRGSGIGPLGLVLAVAYGVIAAFVFCFSGAFGTFGDRTWRDVALILVTIIATLALSYISVLLRVYIGRPGTEPGDPDALSWHLMIPCRDEESVIAATVSAARTSFPFCHVWVIDDASQDRTASIVRGFMDFDVRVHLVSRVPPEARTGKGDALNAAFRKVADYVGSDPDARRSTIIGVLDADGYLSDNTLQLLAGPQGFGDEKVGAVQIEVWMKNRNDRQPRPDAGWFLNLVGRCLVRMQDIEFRTSNSAMQLLRIQTGTVGMGGNGQFTRLTVLDDLTEANGKPWGNKLSEDYELGLNILELGYRNHYIREAHVSQEALPYFRRLLTQRTRWAQGILQCSSLLRNLRRSRRLRPSGLLEIGYFMSQPWITMLNLVLVPVLLGLAVTEYGTGHLSLTSTVMIAAAGLIFLIAPYAAWGPLYRRWGKENISLAAAAAFGLGYLVYVYLTYLYYPRAIGRLITGRNAWAKTKRNADALAPVTALPADLRSVPVLEPEVLAGMAADLGSEAYAREVVSAYVVRWPTRLANLDEAVAAADPVRSRDAIASIKVSSAMIGAPRLETAARSFEELLAAADFERARVTVAALGAVGEATIAEIRRLYLDEIRGTRQ